MMALLIVIPFLFAAGFAAVFRSEKWSGKVAFLASIITLLISIYFYFVNPGTQTVTWFSIGGYALSLSTTLTVLHLVLLCLVALMSALVILYSLGFMKVPSEQSAFYFEISLFAAGMILFAIGADLLTIFIGWELLGITSYLLIGFWRHRDAAISAARKAITIIFIGDILIFAAIILIWTQLHTLSIAAIDASAPSYAIGIAILMIIVGAFTKSAQFPFQEWLPAAMEGPTPVSTLLHSSTMVKAGIFLVALLLPAVELYGLQPILLGVGLVSAVIAALCALSSTHIKRILAYSTIEDIALMFVALGLGSLFAAFALFIFQTFYKGLLFMDAGAVMKSNNDEEDIRKIKTSKSAGVIIPIAIGVAALAGVFPLGGFFGKIAVESATKALPIYAVLVGIQLLSSIYIFRWMFEPLVKEKEKPKKKPKAISHYTVPMEMRLPIYILCAFTLLSGALWIYMPGYLGLQAVTISYLDAIIFSSMIVIGLVVAYMLYYKRTPSLERARIVASRYANIGLGMDFLYAFVIWIAKLCGRAVDGVDRAIYTIVKASGYGLGSISATVDKRQSSSINYYLAVFIVGAVIAIIAFSLI